MTDRAVSFLWDPKRIRDSNSFILALAGITTDCTVPRNLSRPTDRKGGVACVLFACFHRFFYMHWRNRAFILYQEMRKQKIITEHRGYHNAASNNQYFFDFNNKTIVDPPPCRPPQLVHRNSVTQDGRKSSPT